MKFQIKVQDMFKDYGINGIIIPEEELLNKFLKTSKTGWVDLDIFENLLKKRMTKINAFSLTENMLQFEMEEYFNKYSEHKFMKIRKYVFDCLEIMRLGDLPPGAIVEIDEETYKNPRDNSYDIDKAIKNLKKAQAAVNAHYMGYKFCS